MAALLIGASPSAQTAGTGPQTPVEIPTFASQIVDPDVADNESGHALPNACEKCHADKGTAWARDALKSWNNFSAWRV